MEQQLIVYAGDDKRLFGTLEGQLESRGYELEWSRDATPIAEDWLCDRQRLLMLDANLTARTGLAFLQAVKAHNMGTPVIVITDNRTLTNVALARLNGAEALFFKPLTDFEAVLEVIEGAFWRLERWQHVLHERTEPTEARPARAK